MRHIHIQTDRKFVYLNLLKSSNLIIISTLQDNGLFFPSFKMNSSICINIENKINEIYK